jgi:hypothetical protein
MTTIKNCIIACLKSKKQNNYEFVSYNQVVKQEQIHVSKQALIKKIMPENPQFQSTQIESSVDTIDSFYTTALNSTNDENKAHNKISSTLIPTTQPFQLEDEYPSLSQINEESEIEEQSAFTNEYYTSPIISRSVSCSTASSSSLSFSSVVFSEPTVYQSQSDSFNTTNEKLHVCILAYKAKFEGDLTIEFAERVKILHSVNADFALVKNITTHKCGYVPNKCLSSLSDFLGEIARNCHNL